METVMLKKDDLLKAHKEGCSATKKALENLYPGVFKKTEELKEGRLYMHTKTNHLCMFIEGKRMLDLEVGFYWFDISGMENEFKSIKADKIELTLNNGKIENVVEML